MSILLYLHRLLPGRKPGIAVLALLLTVCAALAPSLAGPAGKLDMDKAKQPPGNVAVQKAKGSASKTLEPAPAPPPVETPPPDLITPLKQEFQGKFDDIGKTIANLREGVDKLEVGNGVNAKSIEDLRSKLEENSILVYEHLSRGMESAEKLDALLTRIADIEAKIAVKAKPKQQGTAVPAPAVAAPVATSPTPKPPPKTTGKKSAEPPPEAKAAAKPPEPAAETAPPKEGQAPAAASPATDAKQAETKPAAEPGPGGETKPTPAPAATGEEAKPASEQKPAVESKPEPKPESKPETKPKPAAKPAAEPAPVAPVASPDVSADMPDAPAPKKVAAEDLAWEPLAAAFLVFAALLGFALLEASQLEHWAVPQAGLRNLLVASAIGLSYFAVGHWVMFGEGAGASDAFLGDDIRQTALAMVAGLVVATLLSDRLSLPAYVFLAVLLGAVAYPVLGRWAWAGEGLPDYMGWLEKWGFVDFGGASVIHTFAAGLALAWAFRFPLSRPLAPAGDGTQANASLALLGLAVVWFGWFGLDLGHGGEGPGAAKLIANTLLAGAAALVATLPCVLMVWREATPGAAYARIVAGTVGGLVAISAGVAVARPAEAIFIGALAGLAQPAAYRFLSSKRIKQDAVLANLVAAHGVCGVLGTLLAGFFASPGAFSMPDSERIGVQAGGAAVILAYGLAIGLVSALSYQGGCKLLSLRKVLQRPSK